MTQKQPSKPAGGVLPIPAAATTTKKAAPQQQNQQQPAKKNADAPRLKLLVRRLPPGLTRHEFDHAVGDEWKLGGGKVDYFSFKEGKVSKDPAKPSRPSRAYLRVTSAPLVQELADKVRQTSFHDARNTTLDTALLGPPIVEFAPYSRVPGGKIRKDGRTGTIDQDPDFIAFLESLTNPPAPKPALTDEAATETAQKEEKPTITPLIQFLRDKKANKGKESSSSAAQGKSGKQARGEAKGQQQQQQQAKQKGEKVQAKKLLSRSERAAENKSKADKDKASKDASKPAAANKQAPANKSPETSTKDTTAPPSAPAAERKRERGNISAATKILRRDLGLGPASTTSRKRDKGGGAAAAAAGDKGAGAASTDTSTTTKADGDQVPKSPTNTTEQPKPPTGPKGGKQGGQKSTPARSTKKEQPSTEPAASSQSSTTNAGSNNNNNDKGIPTGPAAAKSNQPPSGPRQQQQQQQQESTATQAFLKHANPSQGVTEDLLHSGFSQFGSVTSVEIDRKKGFGYVDFTEPEGLRKAIQASPVQIAQSQVVVLERRTGPALKETRANNQSNNQQPAMSQAPAAAPQGPRGGRGGRGARGKGGFGRGRGGGRGGGGGGGGGAAKAGASEGS